jgi:hypothetical protein
MQRAAMARRNNADGADLRPYQQSGTHDRIPTENDGWRNGGTRLLVRRPNYDGRVPIATAGDFP